MRAIANPGDKETNEDRGACRGRISSRLAIARCSPSLGGPFRSRSVLVGALSLADAKRRLHLVGRARPDADDRLSAVRQARAVQCREAHGEARGRKDPLPVG